MLLEKLQTFAKSQGSKTALVVNNTAISYAQLWDQVLLAAGQLAKDGPKETYLLQSEHSAQNLVHLLAAMALGRKAIFVPSAQNIQDLAQTLNAGVLGDSLPCQEPLAINKIVANNAQTLFLGVLSSGSTGQAKVIWKDYQAWFTAFPHQTEVFGIEPSHNLLVVDALSYSANLNAVLHHWWQGGTVHLQPLRKANTWRQYMASENIEAVFMVPSHYKLLNDSATSLPQIRSAVSAGEKLSPELAESLLATFPNATITEYYGSAELGHISYHQNQEIVAHPLSVGKAFPEVSIDIKDEQIFVQSPYISPDYRNSNTNADLGYIIDGRLILMGRSGRMFNKRGLNVFAQEIENCAVKLHWVAEVALIGVLQTDGSHKLILYYTSKEPQNKDFGPVQIKAHLKAHLQTAKIPSRIKQLAQLPRKDFGKIDYQALAVLYASSVNSSTILA
jgi:long-chain acyl-CoA synthetase